MSKDLLDHLVRVAYQQCSLRTSLSVEIRTCDSGPSALLPDVGEGAGVAWKEVIGSLLRCRCYLAQGVHTDFQLVG
jgi:hypothetical protein